jgi:DNA-binding transcriptional MocR family regulator
VPALVAEVYHAVRDPTVVPLGAATPSPAILPTEKLNRTLAQVARESGGAGISYDPPPGCPALRRQLAHLAVDWGCALSPDDFLITVGTMEALGLCLRAVTRPGDTVAVESPTYFGLLQVIESLGLRAIEIPLHPRTGMDLDLLDEVLRRHRVRACLAIPNFSNPLGSLMPDDAKERLVAMLARHEVPLVEDDMYGDLYAEPSVEGPSERPRPCKAFDKRGLVMTCGSISKTLAPGYRVGWVMAGRFAEQVEHLKFAQTVGNPTLPAMAIAAYLEEGAYGPHLRQLRRKLTTQVAQLREAVAQYFPSGTRVSRPLGGFVLWVELPAGTNALELHTRALARGISIAPGPIFSAQQRFSNCIRLNCGHPFTDVVDHAVRTLGELARSAT